MLTPEIKQSFAKVESSLDDDELLQDFIRILILFYPDQADEVSISNLLKQHTYPKENYTSPRLGSILNRKLIENDSPFAIVSEPTGYRLIYKTSWPTE